MSKTVWDNVSVVDFYANQWQLYEPEKIIRDILAKDLHSIRMLDIGVGAGRTAHNFAGEVKYYVGIDISAAMLEKCRTKFQEPGNNVSFLQMDATNMHEFEDNSFDFVLFSYNGIDCVDHADRMKILNEIRRVLVPGGWFAFSSHNIYYIPRLYSFILPANPLKFLKHSVKWLLNIIINGWRSKYRSKDYAIIKSGAYGFKLSLYYIKPEYQVGQLGKIGFGNTRTFSFTGRELPVSGTITDDTDPWIYYLCRNEKQGASS